MPSWSLLTEVIALLLITVLVISLITYRKLNSHSLKLYRTCLILSGSAVILDIFCVILIKSPGHVPEGINIFLNSSYFMLEIILCSVTALYIFEKMLEHVYDRFCIVRARTILTILTILYAVIIIVNLKTGIIFSFDSSGGYHRGSLNSIGYVILGIEMCLLLVCYIRHSSSIGKDMRHAIRLFVPVSIVFVILQITDKGLLLNGLIAAFVDLILFISFLCQRREEDNVTGTGNRDGFYGELVLRIRGRQKFQVLLFYPREFGVVNQRYGYQVGNEFLYSIAAWVEHTYAEALAFRYVGVSFAVILPYYDDEQAECYVREFRERFKVPWKLGNIEERFHVSFCSLIYDKEEMQENQLMAVLDYMLSISKRSGQKYVRYDEKIAAGFRRKIELTDFIRKAIDEKKFEVWYQPVYSPEKEKFTIAEALVRLQDKDGKYISPESFIPVAEEAGNVGEIFWIVLEAVCRLIKESPALGLEKISINMSLEQFDEPELVQNTGKMIKDWGVEPERLRFEITERVISDDTTKAGEVIRQMEREGFRFYLDDFGIGYSNFASVVQYHFDSIKLDRSFVEVVETDEKGRNMIQGLIGLFHEMGMEVIAEGTETAGQVEMLKTLGADKIQGFYYARPMPKEKLLEFLKERQ